MDRTRDLKVRILGDSKDLKRALDEGEKHTSGFARALDSAKTGSFALLGGLTVAAGAAVAFGIKSFGAFNAAQEAQTKLATNLLNVKGNTDANVESLSRLASHLQSIGVIEDDVIKAGMSQLATFNLQGATIEKLTPKITDMVAQLKGHNATAEDMVAINNLVGKVMTGNVGALSKYGVTLSDSQKQLLEQGNETQRASVLTEVLAQNYGNVNEALRNTPQGQLTAFKNTFGDFMELVGAAVSNVITPLIKKFNEWADSMGGPEGMLKALKEKFEQIQPYLPVIIGAILGGLVPAFAALAVSVWSAMAPLIPFIAAGALIGFLVKELMDKFGGFQGIMDRLRPVFEVLGNIWNGLILPALRQLWDVIQNQLMPALQQLWERIEPVLMPALKALGIILGVVVVGSILLAIAAITLIVTAITWLVNAFSWVVERIKDYVGLMVGSFISFRDWWVNAVQTVIGWVGNVKDAIGGIVGHIGNALSGVWDAITRPFREAFDWVKDNVGKVVDKLKDLNPFQRHSPSLVDLVTAGTREIRKQYGDMFSSIAGDTTQVNTQQMATALPGASAQSAVPAASNQKFEIHLHVGNFLGTPNELRGFAEEIWRQITFIGRSNGVALPQIGVNVQ